MNTIGFGHKSWWGPRIWRILHCLAEVSDRTDCGAGWRIILQETAAILPCDVCREHFTVAVRGLRLPSLGTAPRSALRRMLWSTHRGVGGDLPENELSSLYGYGGDRSAVVAEVRRLVAEVVGAFRTDNVLDRFRVGHLSTWEGAIMRLAGLLSVPELVAAPTGRRRR